MSAREGQRAADRRPGARSRPHVERAAERTEPVGHVDEAVSGAAGPDDLEPGAVVDDREPQRPVPLGDRARVTMASIAGVLAGVLHRLEHAEVHGRLDLVPSSGRCPSVSTVVGSAARAAAAGSASSSPPDTSSGGKMPWASARSSWIGVLDVALDLVDHRDRVVRVVLDRVTGEAQLDGQRHEVLLGTVVEVALELAPLGVAGGDDAGARLLQLVVAHLQLVEAGLQRGVELHVVQRERDLAGELGQDAVLGLRERLAVGAGG